jgi:hypothetical protein
MMTGGRGDGMIALSRDYIPHIGHGNRTLVPKYHRTVPKYHPTVPKNHYTVPKNPSSRVSLGQNLHQSHASVHAHLLTVA